MRNSVRRRFDRDEAERRKQQGMLFAAEVRIELLALTRNALIDIALSRSDHTATADDAMHWLIEQGKDPSDLGNAAGSLFRGKHWKFTGRWTKSNRVSNHRGDLRIWEYRDGVNQ